MKKVSSIWMLLIRSTIYPLLLVWAAVMGAQALMFWRVLGRAASSDEIDPLRTLYGAVEGSYVLNLFVAGLVLSALVLALLGWKKGAELTLARLRLAPQQVYLCHAVHAAVCYLLYWALQGLLLAGFSLWFASVVPEGAGPQQFFLACWNNRLLHGLFPLHHWPLLVKNLLLMLALGAMTGRRPRPGTESGSRFPMKLLGAALVVGLLFPTALGLSDLGIWVVAAAAALVAAGAVYIGLGKGDEQDE